MEILRLALGLSATASPVGCRPEVASLTGFRGSLWDLIVFGADPTLLIHDRCLLLSRRVCCWMCCVWYCSNSYCLRIVRALEHSKLSASLLSLSGHVFMSLRRLKLAR